MPGTSQIGEIPHDARVTPEQAESALGHNQATEFDEDVLEMMDLDQREEEEALTGRQVNPGGVDYSFSCWTPDVSGAAEERPSAEEVGWPKSTPKRALTKNDFACTKAGIVKELERGIQKMFTIRSRVDN